MILTCLNAWHPYSKLPLISLWIIIYMRVDRTIFSVPLNHDFYGFIRHTFFILKCHKEIMLLKKILKKYNFIWLMHLSKSVTTNKALIQLQLPLFVATTWLHLAVVCSKETGDTSEPLGSHEENWIVYSLSKPNITEDSNSLKWKQGTIKKPTIG